MLKKPNYEMSVLARPRIKFCKSDAPVEVVYQRGLRHLGLLHDSDASVPLGDVYTNSPHLGGLTEFGASVIQQCNRLGILVELAHADLQTTKAALKVTTKPVIISHTGLDTQLGSDPRLANMMHPLPYQPRAGPARRRRRGAPWESERTSPILLWGTQRISARSPM